MWVTGVQTCALPICVDRSWTGFQPSGASASAVATAAVNNLAPDLVMVASLVAAVGGSGSWCPSRGWSCGGDVLGGVFVSWFRRCVDACSGVGVEPLDLSRSVGSSGSSSAQESWWCGGRSGASGAGFGSGSVVAVVRSTLQVPALVDGRLLQFSGMEMLSSPGMVEACWCLLRRLAGGGVRQVQRWFSVAVVLMLLLRQFVLACVCTTLVCSLL